MKGGNNPKTLKAPGYIDKNMIEKIFKKNSFPLIQYQFQDH